MLFLKENLHIISVTILIFEINKLYFLEYGSLGYNRKRSKKDVCEGSIWHIIFSVYVFERESPICDVAGGTSWETINCFQKGIPLCKTFIIETIFSNTS